MLADEIRGALKALNLERVEPGDYAKTGYCLEVTATPEQMPEVAQAMLESGAE